MCAEVIENDEVTREVVFSVSVVDCQVTPWGPWSSCDTDCGPGMMSRVRSIEVQPQNGGRHCPSLEQRRGCHVSDCHRHQDEAIKGKCFAIFFIPHSIVLF